MQEQDIPYFHDGVDYSEFTPKLKAYYRAQHLKDIGWKPPKANSTTSKAGTFSNRGRTAVERFSSPDFLEETMNAWTYCTNHGDLAFHEVFHKADGGAKGHVMRCEAQYSRFAHLRPVKKPSVKVLRNQSTILNNTK